MSKPSEVEDEIVTAVEKAADCAGIGFNALISIHLKQRHNSTLREMVKTPPELHKALVELFGDYTTRLLETLAVEVLLRGDKVVDLGETDLTEVIENMRRGTLDLNRPKGHYAMR
jgi:hypothetical protein